MRISLRLLSNSVLIAGFAVIVTTLLIGAMSYTYGKNILEQQAEDRLILVRELKADSVSRYFKGLKNQVITFSHNLTIISAMQQFDAGFSKYANEVSNKGGIKYDNAVIQRYIRSFSNDYAKSNNGIQFDATPYLNLKNESTFALQYNYIFSNPFGIDKESRLDAVNDGTTYSKVHKQFHDQLRQFKELYDFEDIFLVNSAGDIVYTVAKGLDFTTSLENGPYSKTELGAVFREANKLENSKQAVISNFAPYSPSNDDQAAFIAAPIFAENQKIGILIFQLNLNVLNDIMTSSNAWKAVGLGETGEAYLVDSQYYMLTPSRFYLQNSQQYLKDMQKLGMDADTIARIEAKQNNAGWQKVKDVSVSKALADNSGFEIYKDYRNVEVLATFAPIDVLGQTWAIICKIDAKEAFAPIKELAHKFIWNLVVVVLLLMVFAIVVGIGLARQISLPIEKLSTMIQMLANTQDLTQRVDYQANDEIGDMAKALNQLLESFQRTCQETIISTQHVQFAAHKLMSLAEDIDAREATHKYEDNFASVHEKTEAIKEAGDSLEALSDRLQVLSRQFKVFEAENERTSNW
jgi:methyl-accepting chemotaxis protein